MCNIETKFEYFHKNFRECKNCNSKRRLKPYYKNKHKISNQQETSFKKNREHLLQKQNKRYIIFKELLRSYVALENRIKALEESFSTNDSKNNQTPITNKTIIYHIDAFKNRIFFKIM